MNKTLACTLALLSLCVAMLSLAQSQGDAQPVNPCRIGIEAEDTPAVKSAPKKATSHSVEFAAYDEPLSDEPDSESETTAEEPDVETTYETEEHTLPAPPKKK